jgi:hypothetical protein
MKAALGLVLMHLHSAFIAARPSNNPDHKIFGQKGEKKFANILPIFLLRRV